MKVSELAGWWSMFVGIDADVTAVYKRPPDPMPSVDVNGDGIVNILDLVLISVNFGKTGQNPADVNGDGVVNIVDLVKVAGEMGLVQPAFSTSTNTGNTHRCRCAAVAHASTAREPHRCYLSTRYFDA